MKFNSIQFNIGLNLINIQQSQTF